MTPANRFGDTTMTTTQTTQTTDKYLVVRIGNDYAAIESMDIAGADEIISTHATRGEAATVARRLRLEVKAKAKK